jgi:hypothetical protein
MKIKRFLENITQEPIVLYNNKGDLKLGSIRVSQRGLSGTIYIESIDDVDWVKSRIVFYSYSRGMTEWRNILPESLDKLSDEIKELIYQKDKEENYLMFTFYLENDLAKLVHIGPEFKRTKDGGVITSYIDKLTY